MADRINNIDFEYFDYLDSQDLRYLIFNVGDTHTTNGQLYIFYDKCNLHITDGAKILRKNEIIQEYEKLNENDKKHVMARWNACFTQDVEISETDEVINKIYFYRIFNTQRFPYKKQIKEMLKNELKTKKYINTFDDFVKLSEASHQKCHII